MQIEVFLNGQPVRIDDSPGTLPEIGARLGADPSKQLTYYRTDDPMTGLQGGAAHSIEPVAGMRFTTEPDPDAEVVEAAEVAVSGRIDLPAEDRSPRVYVLKPSPVEAHRTATTIYNNFQSQKIVWAQPGDWIVTFPDGRKEVLSDPVFRATYMLVNQHV